MIPGFQRLPNRIPDRQECGSEGSRPIGPALKPIASDQYPRFSNICPPGTASGKMAPMKSCFRNKGCVTGSGTGCGCRSWNERRKRKMEEDYPPSIFYKSISVFPRSFHPIPSSLAGIVFVMWYTCSSGIPLSTRYCMYSSIASSQCLFSAWPPSVSAMTCS